MIERQPTPSILHEKTIATILNRLMLEFLSDLEFDKIQYKGLAYEGTSIIRGYLKGALTGFHDEILTVLNLFCKQPCSPCYLHCQ